MEQAMFARIAAAGALALTAYVTASADKIKPQIAQQAFLDKCEDWDDWSKPAPPFKIYGDTYYVGTCGISAILITTREGHILIDGASRDGGPLVEASIAKLGFRIEDVKILLNSHEHFDHVGGLAYLQRRSGAQMIAANAAVQGLTTGETQPGDPQFGTHDPFEPVTVTFAIGSYNPVSLGKVTLMPLETPGHTAGALTWSWLSCEKTDCKSLVYADSLSPVSSDSYRFSDNPEVVSGYRKGLTSLAELPCDMLLTPHLSSSQMIERMATGGLAGGMNCREYAQSIQASLNKRLAEEADKK
jgi:metallo-beta-lactamase class B